MESKEYLNEENYQKANTKLIKISKIVLFIGLGICLLLLILGILNKRSIEKESIENQGYNNKQISSVDEQLQKKNEELEKAKEDLKTEKSNLKAKLEELKSLREEKETLRTKLQRESTEIFMNERGRSANYYAKQDEIKAVDKEISELSDQISSLDTYVERDFDCFFLDTSEKEGTFKIACDLESKITSLNEEINDLEKEKNKLSNTNIVSNIYNSSKYFVAILPVLWLTLMISGMLYFIAKRRNILAYSIQSTMPVAQEAIEKAAPTIGKAGASIVKEMAPVYGDIAKEISKGIKEGLKDEKKDEEAHK